VGGGEEPTSVLSRHGIPFFELFEPPYATCAVVKRWGKQKERKKKGGEQERERTRSESEGPCVSLSFKERLPSPREEEKRGRSFKGQPPKERYF